MTDQYELMPHATVVGYPEEIELSNTHANNWLNDLNAKQWIKLVRSWFTIDASHEPEWLGMKQQHPGTYPKDVPARLIEIYSKKGHTILDPMMGTGSTLIAAAMLGRRGIGIDLSKEYVDLAREIINRHYYHRQQVPLDAFGGGIGEGETHKRLWNPEMYVGDSVRQLIDNVDDESVHYTVFSPPYSNALRTDSNTGVLTRTKEREEAGLSNVYSDDPRDIGNVLDDDQWLAYLQFLARELYRVTIPGRYMTMVIQNYVGIEYRPLAFMVSERITAETPWVLRPEHIWTQAEKKNRIHGWPSRWLPTNAHHYCLNWQKPKEA